QAQFRGEIAQQFFLGDRTRLHVAGIAEGPIVVETTEHREFRAGEKVGLRAEPGALLVLRR
ncbi:MAG TPA: TOBE domain-containing protein, partial [Solirubrobacteraceae bacterium]|nr:TOBE domain-containing protein [Solirubrobacteraceae bacterium]